jgi:hypothetical protein
VVKPDGNNVVFERSERGLYYLDTQKNTGHSKDMVMVNTVAANRARYTKADYERAVLARKLQIKIGRPSIRDYIRIIEKNMLPNCDVTRQDIIAAEDIFGPDVGSLKGKTTRRPPHKVRDQPTWLPREILARYKAVTLTADIMYINKIPFLVTKSRSIHFATIEALANQKGDTIVECFKTIKQLYTRGGFQPTLVLTDGQFESIRAPLADMQLSLNTTAEDEHVGDIERYIRTVKERSRATYNTLPFLRMPPRLVIEMAKLAVFWLNAFPHRNGVSDDMSPRMIVTGQKVDHNRHCKYEFGEYVQTHESHDNSMDARTVGALALRPTGNQQGSYYFFSLQTGRVLTRNHATRIPMPQEVIDRVHTIARRQKAQPGLVFQDRNRQPILNEDEDEDGDDGSYEYESDPDDYDHVDDLSFDDENSDEEGDAHQDDGDGSDADADDYDEETDNDDDSADSEYVPPTAPEADNDQDLDEFNDADVEENDNALLADEDGDHPANSHVQNDEHPIEETVIETVNEDEDGAEITGVPELDESTGVAVGAENTGVRDEEEEAASGDELSEAERQANLERLMNTRYGARSERYELRRRKPRSYHHLHHQRGIVLAAMASMATEQMSMKKGLKAFGGLGWDAVRSEMQQLHDRKVMRPVRKGDLSADEIKRTLNYLMFLKRKRSGKVKGRGCADGRKQRLWTRKEDSTSPTACTESVLTTCAIDAKEDRDVATVDIPGAFMQTDMDDEIVHIRLTGEMVETLLEIDHETYAPYVVIERGTQVIYARLLKALYGTLRAARMFYDLITKKFEAWGFEQNPYDPCVANKMVDGHQCTIVWHVDDLKISHKSPDVVTNVIDLLQDEFGEITPVTAVRGKVHDYLGMELDFRVKGKVSVNMCAYLEAMFEELPQHMRGRANTPAANHLFQTREDDSLMLSPEEADRFHHLTAKLMFLSQHGRPDIRTAVSYLSTRVSCSNSDDEKKLSRVMKYLQSTRDLVLTLSVDDGLTMKWWVDASYAPHTNMRSHTGAIMTLGGGSFYSTSTRQKLVSRSSTEAELIGVHDVLPQMLWTKHFLEEQGYEIGVIDVLQDNKSAMLLEMNGRGSSTKRTKHINVRYFYVKDLVTNKHIAISHCPTEDMIADFFTKPLQGIQFRRFRSFIMNVDPSSPYYMDPRSVLKHSDYLQQTSRDGDVMSDTSSNRYEALSEDAEDDVEEGEPGDDRDPDHDLW